MGQTKQKHLEEQDRRSLLDDVEAMQRWQLEQEYTQQLIEAMEASQYKH